MTIQKCCLCEQEKKLIKAHIIPRKFFDPLKLDNKGLRIYSETDKPKQKQCGIYDETILCDSCDNQHLGVWDKYAQDLLLENLINRISGQSIEIQCFDYEKLKLFFMSVLWRSAITKEIYFKNINLNEFWKSKLREMIVEKDPGNDDDFSVQIFRYIGIGINQDMYCITTP